jgi:hypothetical protein
MERRTGTTPGRTRIATREGVFQTPSFSWRSFLGLAPWRYSLVLLVACGYQAAYSGQPGRLHVKVVRSLVADAVAADEVASGVREQLARAGALESGEAYPRVEIEVLRADETSEGVRAGAAGPLARGTDVAVVGRAWIARGPGQEPEGDTGDLRAEETVSVDQGPASPDPRASGFHHADALRAAARRLGRSLGSRVLGLPATSEETD